MNSEKLTYTINEAAKALGIGRSLAYDLARQGDLPVIRFGKRLLIPRKQLLKLLGDENNE